jgi:DNA mismatch endonuclease (patch repair protein)
METPAKRSRIMRAIKGKDTQPEFVVRRLCHGLGYRYRLHRADLPGKPDLVFVSLKKVIFVHGCFWHGHSCARGNRVPKNNRRYWVSKVAHNSERDKRHRRDLRDRGWRVLVLWECELKAVSLERRIVRFLERV